MAEPTSRRIEAVRAKFEAQDQGHVFAHWEGLGASERCALLDQAERLAPRLEALRRAWERAVGSATGQLKPSLAPAPAVVLPEHGGDPSLRTRARETGLRLLADGRVGVFVVAGGQGTRLGFDGAKGAYPIGPISGRSLFEIQAQKIRGLIRRTGRRVPWYVMTSPATDAETVALFEQNDFFGLPREEVLIFSQEMVPAFDPSGRLFMERADLIFENPGGHGGALTALLDSGALDHMRDRGIDRLFYYQVDNPLVEMADPTFMGLHELDGAEMSCKVIRKNDPMEKVGIVALLDGRPGIVEYTELEDTERYLQDEQGRLVFWAGNIAIHAFNTDFIRRIAERADEMLPYHASEKKIPTIDADGNAIQVGASNGHKLERFVFDALPQAARVCVQEVRANEEFSPIKNAEGRDSPDTARRALGERYQQWLKGTPLEAEVRGRILEIDHAVIDGPNDVNDANFQSLDEARDAIQIATGMSS